MRAIRSSPPAAPPRAARFRSAYLILALRAVGLDAGPMGGFDAAKVEAEFFPEGTIKANVIINIGYGDDAKLFPRSPRFDFDQMAKIL